MELFEQPIIAGVPNYAILQCVQPLDFATNFRKIAAVATTLNHSLYDGINWNFFLGYDQPPEPPFQRLKNFTWSNVGDDLDATLRFFFCFPDNVAICLIPKSFAIFLNLGGRSRQPAEQ